MSMIFVFALLCSQQAIGAEQRKDIYVEGMFEEEKTSLEQHNEQPVVEEREANPDVVDSKVSLGFRDFLQMIVATLFVIGLLYMTLRFINKKSRSYKSSQLIENLGGTTLGTNRSVQLVKVGNRILVVGVGDSIRLLTEIDDENECQRIVEEYNRRIDQLAQPGDIVTKIMEKLKREKPTDQKTDEFQLMLNNELKEISEGRKNLYEQMEKKGTDER